MKNKNRLRLFGGLAYLIVIGVLLLIIFNGYVLVEHPANDTQHNNEVVIGLSIQEGSGDSSNLNIESEVTDLSTLLIPQNPFVSVYLEYIAVYDNAPISDIYCVSSIILRHGNPFLDTDRKIPRENSMGELDAFPGEYSFRFENPQCIAKGNKYLLPHLFLGYVLEDATANLGIVEFSGYESFSYFPFDQKEIVLEASLDSDVDTETKLSLSPGLEIVNSESFQDGWVVNTIVGDQGLTLRLTRLTYYKMIFVLVYGALTIVLILLSITQFDVQNVMQIYLGILFGLSGTRAILVPDFVQSSFLVDISTSISFVLVLFEMVSLLVNEQLSTTSRDKLRISEIGRGDIKSEWVEIENLSILSVDMKGWMLFDMKGHRYIFPPFILRGRGVFGKSKTVKVWTKQGENNISNLYWSKKKAVWNDRDVTIHLANSTGKVLFVYEHYER
ncbi:MAG TPA: lamin tail domain-containing protein [Anaerolineales bacterium]|nr:lamin tail domain-containing protein [Anaerolineales bacterium]